MSLITRLHLGILPSKSAGCSLSSLQRIPFLPSVHSPSQVVIEVLRGLVLHSDWPLPTRGEGRQVFSPVGAEQAQLCPSQQ